MNKIKFTHKSILLAVILMFFFTSCVKNDGHLYDDNDDHYTSLLVGAWKLIEDSYGPVPHNETSLISFYENGTGSYEGYNIYGKWDKWNIYWDSYYNSELIIYFPDGEEWYYYWEIEQGYLYLYNMDDPNYYYIYRPLYW